MHLEHKAHFQQRRFHARLWNGLEGANREELRYIHDIWVQLADYSGVAYARAEYFGDVRLQSVRHCGRNSSQVVLNPVKPQKPQFKPGVLAPGFSLPRVSLPHHAGRSP